MNALIRPGDIVEPWITIKRHCDPVVELGRPYLVVEQVVLAEDPPALWECEPTGAVSRLMEVGDGVLELTKWFRQREISRTVGRPESL